MPADLMLRLARSAVFAVVCCGLASVAHLLAGGTVTAQTMALGSAVGLGVGVLAAGRERSFAVILPLLGTGQVTLHLLFSSFPEVATVETWVPSHVSHESLSPGLGMLLMHAGAVVLTAWWLARGEIALWGLLRGLATRVVWFLYRWSMVVASADPLPVGAERERPVAGAASVWLSHAVVRRGPPAA